MTLKEIETRQEEMSLHDQASREVNVAWALWEIALQLARYNEYNARMEARYMELTARGIKRKYKGRSTKDKERRE